MRANTVIAKWVDRRECGKQVKCFLAIDRHKNGGMRCRLIAGKLFQQYAMNHSLHDHAPSYNISSNALLYYHKC